MRFQKEENDVQMCKCADMQMKKGKFRPQIKFIAFSFKN
jgi:hypothetical protein